MWFELCEDHCPRSPARLFEVTERTDSEKEIEGNALVDIISSLE